MAPRLQASMLDHRFNDLASLHDALIHFATALGESQLLSASQSGICCVRVIQKVLN